jgi:hypothetical protein
MGASSRGEDEIGVSDFGFVPPAEEKNAPTLIFFGMVDFDHPVPARDS